MTIKAVVCDMDGTLLSSKHNILPKTFEKLLQLQEEGVRLILASGRSYIRLLPDAMRLQMDKYAGLLIDVNGTSIYQMDSKKRHRIGQLDKNDIDVINSFFSLFNVEIQYSQDDTIYTYLPDSIYTLKKNIRGEMKLPEDYPWTGGMYGWLCDTRDGYPNQIMVRELAESPSFCNKASIVQDPQYMDFVKNTLKNHVMGEKYEYVFSDERKMEITRKGITKGRALDILLKELHIKNDEVIIFGDSENDVSMFHQKKYTIAMKNALSSAKKYANYITSSHNDEGIYHMLTQLESEGIL